jgi:hypothetical protein
MLIESLRFNDMTHAYAVIAAKSNVAVIANESVLEGYRFSQELSKCSEFHSYRKVIRES